jgi:uncharacterized protein
MKTRILTLADRLTEGAIALIAAANFVFFAFFLMTLTLMPAPARAQESTITCRGADLLAQMKATDPQTLARIEAEAAGTVNGKGLLWKIEKDGVAPSYLFGTMHLTDDRVVTLTPAAQKAYDGAQTIVIETTDVLDEQKAAIALMSHPDLMMFTDSTTLDSLLSPQDKAIVEAGLKERGVPLASVQKMKPWMLAAVIAIPTCEQQRKQAGRQILDIKLANEAKAAGKEIAGLETMVDQINAMASLPVEFHIKGLVETLKLGNKLEDLFETMIVLYERGETGMVWPLFRQIQPAGTENDADGYAAFEEALINTRNVTMADHAGPIITKGKAFIAVGALHLPGEKGLIELLRKRGYTVTPAG